MDLVSDLAGMVTDLTIRNTYLKGVMEGVMTERDSVEKKLDAIKETQPNQAIYAQMLQTKTTQGVPSITGMSKRTPQLAQVVIIKPQEGMEKTDREVLRQKIMGLMNPAKDKVKIKGIRKIRDGGLVVETATEEDLCKIERHGQLKACGYKVTKAGASNPRIVVFDVPRNLSEKDVVETIYSQNEDLFEVIAKEEFKTNFALKFRMGRRAEETTNWVVEVSPKIRTILRADDKQY